MTSDPGEIVQAGYDRVAARYRELEHDSARWPRAEWIGELTKGLRPGAAVLDLGCATGVPVVAELARQYRLTGVDISSEHIQQATRNVPDAEDEHRALLERARTWLRPDGPLLLCIEDIDEPGTVAEWLGVDMYFSMFSADALANWSVQPDSTSRRLLWKRRLRATRISPTPGSWRGRRPRVRSPRALAVRLSVPVEYPVAAFRRSPVFTEDGSRSPLSHAHVD
jgi:SAM-dependent methyltransferase